MADYLQYRMIEHYVNKLFVWVFTDPLRLLKNKCGTYLTIKSQQKYIKVFKKCEFKLNIRQCTATPGDVKPIHFHGATGKSMHLFRYLIFRNLMQLWTVSTVLDAQGIHNSHEALFVCVTSEKRVWKALY